MLLIYGIARKIESGAIAKKICLDLTANFDLTGVEISEVLMLLHTMKKNQQTSIHEAKMLKKILEFLQKNYNKISLLEQIKLYKMIESFNFKLYFIMKKPSFTEDLHDLIFKKVE